LIKIECNSMALGIITDLPSLEALKELLENNPGAIIIRFTAKWCKPCQMVVPLFYNLLNYMPNNVLPVVLDVDISTEIYIYMKRYKLLNGIPAFMCFYKENLSYVPDDICIGADQNQLKLFFERCYVHLKKQTE
jgi:thiol:disulfide interchange protein